MNYGKMIKQHINLYCGEPETLTRYTQETVDEYVKEMVYEYEKGVLIATLEQCLQDDLKVLITVGLSNHILEQGLYTVPTIRQELMMVVMKELDSSVPERVLATMAHIILESHNFLARGQVIELGQKVFSDSDYEFDCLLCVDSAFFPEEFAFFEFDNLFTVFVELIPIYQNEASFIKQHGLSAFIDKTIEHEVDFLDYNRKSIFCENA